MRSCDLAHTPGTNECTNLQSHVNIHLEDRMVHTCPVIVFIPFCTTPIEVSGRSGSAPTTKTAERSVCLIREK